MRDPNTGKMSGFIYDIMQEVGRSLNLKVEYTLEVPWDSIPMSLQSGKADAHCAGIWATPSRGRVMAFSNHWVILLPPFLRAKEIIVLIIILSA